MREHEKFVKQEPSSSIHHTSVTQTESKIGPTKIISVLGNGGGGEIREEKSISCPTAQLGLRRKRHQNDSSDFLCCPVIEVEAHLIRSYFMCEHTQN